MKGRGNDPTRGCKPMPEKDEENTSIPSESFLEGSPPGSMDPQPPDDCPPTRNRGNPGAFLDDFNPPVAPDVYISRESAEKSTFIAMLLLMVMTFCTCPALFVGRWYFFVVSFLGCVVAYYRIRKLVSTPHMGNWVGSLFFYSNLFCYVCILLLALVPILLLLEHP
jgi:hypothetical protein